MLRLQFWESPRNNSVFPKLSTFSLETVQQENSPSNVKKHIALQSLKCHRLDTACFTFFPISVISPFPSIAANNLSSSSAFRNDSMGGSWIKWNALRSIKPIFFNNNIFKWKQILWEVDIIQIQTSEPLYALLLTHSTGQTAPLQLGLGTWPKLLEVVLRIQSVAFSRRNTASSSSSLNSLRLRVRQLN